MKKWVKIIIGVSSALLTLGIAVSIIVPVSVNAVRNPAAPRVNKNKKHIACIGDSLTYGVGTFFRDYESYPAFLSKKVPQEYQILNYGLSGRTATSTGNYPYINERFYNISKEVKADIYIIMLGTNDSKADNWSKAGDNGISYKTEFKQIVESYKNLDNNPTIYVMQPPRAYPRYKSGLSIYGINNDLISTTIYDYVQEIADELNINCIDLYNFTKDHPGWYSDGVHFKASGYKEIANYISELLTYPTD